MYGKIVAMLEQIERHFKALAGGADRIYRNNLKFHSLMVLSWALNGGTTLPAVRIPHLDLAKITRQQLKAVTDWVFAEFDAFGAEDKTAKDRQFTEKLKADWSIEKTQP
jgi:hypothetical protein